MDTTATASPHKQHLIDPEICIRCNTCEETCPVDAITHDDNNYVVDADKCNFCMDCISPCPTGSIDNWRRVPRMRAYTVDEQFGWEELPPELSADDLAAAGAGPLEAELDEVPPDLERDRQVLRLAQEALTNALRHSAASRVDLVLRRRDGGLELEVSDDGIGFDPDEPELRANLAGSQMVGLVMARYVVGVEPLASVAPEVVAKALAPVLQHYLTGDLDATV